MVYLHVADLKRVMVVGDLTQQQTGEFRERWKTAFTRSEDRVHMHMCPACVKGQGNSWSYDWHGIASRHASCDDVHTAIGAVAVPDEAGIIIFEERCNVPAIRVQFAEFKKWLLQHQSIRADMYFTPEDLSWTLVITHEASGGDDLGPYFVRRTV